MEAPRDQNHVPSALGVSSSDHITTFPFLVDPITGRVLVDIAGSGSVTSIATGTGLTGGTITTTGTIALDSKLAPLDTLGTALQSVRVNSAATALEYYTPSSGGSPGGSTTQVQYNSSGSFAGSANFTFSGTNLQIQSLETTLYADMFSGSDIGAQINTAYAALPSTGGVIRIPSGTFSFSTPIVFGTSGKFVSLIGTGGASTYLKFTATSGKAITYNCGNPTGHLVYEISEFTLMGSSTLIAAGQTNTNTSIGIFYGGSQGAVGINTHDMNVNGFGSNWEISSNAYMLSFRNCSNSGGNGGQASRGSLLHIDAASNSGERNVIDSCNFTDPGNSLATNAIYITNAGTASNFFTNNSLDDVQLFVSGSNGQTVISYNHIENPAFGTYPQYIPILGASSDLSTQITFIGNEIANDGTNSGNTFQTIIKHGGQLFAAGNHINNYGGATITAFVDHSLDNGLSSDLVGMTQVQGGGLTNLIAGSGGVAYSQAVAAGWVQNVANSYTIGMYANGSNVNNFFSGSNTVATFDHNGDWVLGNGNSSTTTLKGSLILDGSTSGSTTVVVASTASGTLTLPSVTDTVAALAATQTFTNKRITRRLTTVNAPGATPTTNSDNDDIANFTGVATAITSMSTNLSGTPVDGDLLEFRFTDAGTGEAITWGAKFGATTIALPTITVASTMLRVLFEWNATASLWQCIAVA